MVENITSETTTHMLHCSHRIGRNAFDYEMPCHILSTTKSGSVKILVFGSRYWKNTGHHKRIRYVDKNRLRENEGVK